MVVLYELPLVPSLSLNLNEILFVPNIDKY